MKTCPICREEHEQDRGLSFDGKGVNSCGMYRTRIATFTSGATDDDTRRLGPLFAAAPELYQALASIENDDGRIPATIWAMREAALAKVRGE